MYAPLYCTWQIAGLPSVHTKVAVLQATVDLISLHSQVTSVATSLRRKRASFATRGKRQKGSQPHNEQSSDLKEALMRLHPCQQTKSKPST